MAPVAPPAGAAPPRDCRRLIPLIELGQLALDAGAQALDGSFRSLNSAGRTAPATPITSGICVGPETEADQAVLVHGRAR